MKENNNIILGAKDPKKPTFYHDLYDFMKEIGIIKLKYFILPRYTLTDESPQYKELHFKNEYLDKFSDHLYKLDFESVARLPIEKEICSLRLCVHYVSSGKMFGFQICEAHGGLGGTFNSVSKAVILLDTEAQRAITLLKPILN